ncbi:kanamycin kinase/aminoglycoside 3'-phosphotransferase-2 [Crossiella equi]|uniref:Kanamycin kinase/aminoglycoside 3'-phosphotransferase-2 n=1 Tax=Crossiella equi TaxID=130796 RepID=A0ABS5ABP5_9PSEU|nr:APH(3') family aminoglycoside O-phosphotransferase [Crossiella equi]MBP2473712.1 kanamycin kinase/aminoglycoside 3'-phosphotransferase-2 [Crossiella equi]
MAELLSRLGATYGRDWVPVTAGESGAQVWRAGGRPGDTDGRGCFIKVALHPPHPDPSFLPHEEAARCQWLAARGFPAPEVVEHGAEDGMSWLVTRALPGRPATGPWSPAQAVAAADALADLARALHALPVADCPFDRRLAVTVPLARAAAEAGAVNLADLDEEREGWPVARLLDELDRTLPATEETVVCHGDLCTPNVLLDPDTLAVTGVLDLGRLGVADRHLDLALVSRSLADNGLDADRFLASYGYPRQDWDRIAFYRLLDEFF